MLNEVIDRLSRKKEPIEETIDKSMEESVDVLGKIRRIESLVRLTLKEGKPVYARYEPENNNERSNDHPVEGAKPIGKPILLSGTFEPGSSGYPSSDGIIHTFACRLDTPEEANALLFGTKDIVTHNEGSNGGYWSGLVSRMVQFYKIKPTGDYPVRVKQS